MITLYTGRGGLPEVRIQNAAASCEISLMGAHVLSYCPAGHREVLFLSERSEYSQTGKAIRGGIPICWPWFGPANKELLPNATTSHGFIRQQMWHVATWRDIAPDCTEVVLEATDTAESRAIWPHGFRLQLAVRVGAALELKLTTTNTDNDSFPYAQALHTYYAVGDCEKIAIEGFDGCAFIDKAPATPPAANPQPGDVVIREETDRVYLHCPGTATISDPVMGRRIVIRKSGSDTGVVWNPWIAKSHKMPDFGDLEYRNMVCVETCNVDYDARTLAPGESHTLEVQIAIEAL